MKTILDVIQSGTAYLEKKNVSSARLQIEHLLAHVLGCKRMELYLQFDRPMEEKYLVDLRELTRQRGERIPLQHLLGTTEFFGRSFQTDSRALIPRPETEELVEMVLKEIVNSSQEKKPKILDMGCGSGVIGLSLALELPEAEVTLADVSADALALAQENANALSVPKEQVTFVETNLWEKIDTSFHCIVANLPYIPTEAVEKLAPEVQHDPMLALDGGADGLACIEKFLHPISKHLTEQSILFLELEDDQAQAVADQLKENKDFAHVEIRTDLADTQRFVFGRAGKKK